MTNHPNQSPSLSSGLLQAVLEQVSDVVLVVDREGRIARSFRAAHLGYDDADLVGREVFELVHENYLDLSKRTFEQISENAAPEAIELEAHRANGETAWYEISPAHYADPEGGIWIVVVARNIQQRRVAEAALRERERHYRSLVDQSPLGVLIVDRDLTVVSANEAYVRQVGAPNVEALENHNILMSPALDSAAAEPVIERVIQGDTVRMPVSYRSIFDKQVDVDVTISPISNDDGEMVGAQMLFLDVSESRQLEEQLRQSQKMEAVGRLAGGISHDFNNNLTVILGLAEFLADSADLGDDESSAATEILLAAERSAALTRQLLTFSRPNQAVLEPTNLGQIVARLEPLLRLAVSGGIEVETSVPAEIAAIHADPQLLEQVILNLAVNANDAMPDGGTLRLDIRSDADGRVVLDVSDDGIGMDESTRVRSIEPFFTTKKEGEGTGLGLALVYGIVKQFDGGVEIESELGRGTHVRLSFPPLDAEAVGRAVSNVRLRRRPRPQGHERILVLEDQQPVRNFLSTTLRRQGYDVLEADSGQLALDLARRASPSVDLILSDVRLPDLSGPDTVSLLRSDQPDLRVLYISGFNDVTARNGIALEDGFELLAKPFTAHRLLDRIRATLDSPSQIDA